MLKLNPYVIFIILSKTPGNNAEKIRWKRELRKRKRRAEARSVRN